MSGDRCEADPQPEVLTHSTLVYSVVRFSVWCALRTLWRSRIEGLEHLPRQGPAVIACNHQSGLDIPIVAHSSRRHICFAARQSLADFGPMAFLLRQTGSVLLKRNTADRTAVREMIEHLDRGDLLCVFPEGTRSRDGRIGEFRGGALLAARRARVPIIPAGIRGSGRAWPRDARWPRLQRVALRYGPPIDSALPDALERLVEAVDAMVGDGDFDSVPPI